MALQAALEAENITDHLRDIAFLDKVLIEKQAAEQVATEARLQKEEEVLLSLKEAISTGDELGTAHAKAILNNSQQFINLIGSCATERESAQRRRKQIDDDETMEYKDQDKKLLLNSVAKASTFIIRNKRLAKCGRGLLSLTDEEKQRVKELLTDESEDKVGDMFTWPPRLNFIDKELEKFAEEKIPFSFSNKKERPWKRGLKARICRLEKLNAKLAEQKQQEVLDIAGQKEINDVLTSQEDSHNLKPQPCEVAN